jgi:hypothetical protein
MAIWKASALAGMRRQTNQIEKNEAMKGPMMRLLCLLGTVALLCFTVPVFANEPQLVALLRAQAFNKVFEGFEFYNVTIESDLAQTDGTHEVTAVASGRFLEHSRRVKALFLVGGDSVIGGQVLEETGLPPCIPSSGTQASSL